MTTTVCNREIGEVERKILDFNDLVKRADYNAKFQTFRQNILLPLIIASLQVKYLKQRIS